MTKYEEYKNRIQDIKYIFLSNKMDLIDYQYVLTLIHEAVFVVSEDLIYELKDVLKNVNLNKVDEIIDITNEQTYQYLLWEIKKDINNYNTILEKTKMKIINILTELNNATNEINNNQITSFEKNNLNDSFQSTCSENCISCNNPCNITSIIKNEVIENNDDDKQNLIDIIQTSTIIKENYFNPKNLKDYLLYNNMIKNECSICGLSEWQNTYLPLKLDFIDGNFINQNLTNIRLLCPNCFSQVGHIND